MKTLHTGDYATFKKLYISEYGFKIVGQMFHETSKDVIDNVKSWLDNDEDYENAFTNNEVFIYGVLSHLNGSYAKREDLNILFYVKDENLPVAIQEESEEYPDGFMDGYHKLVVE